MTHREHKASQRHSYHIAVKGTNRNHGHTATHSYGRLYWAYRANGVEVKCSPPKGKHQRRGF